jgi:uncharacterized protein (DUF2126 family)
MHTAMIGAGLLLMDRPIRRRSNAGRTGIPTAMTVPSSVSVVRLMTPTTTSPSVGLGERDGVEMPLLLRTAELRVLHVRDLVAPPA